MSHGQSFGALVSHQENYQGQEFFFFFFCMLEYVDLLDYNTVYFLLFLPQTRTN